jgi:segregation and condensation protein A
MAGGCYRPEPLPLWRVPDALARLRRLLPTAPPGGAPLERFLPNVARGGAGRELQRRAALASTLLAGLDLSRGGVATLVQRAALGPILLAATAPPAG